MSTVLILLVAKCTNIRYIVDHNAIGATDQQILHKKLSDWLNFNRKLLLHIQIASATGKQLNISVPATDSFSYITKLETAVNLCSFSERHTRKCLIRSLQYRSEADMGMGPFSATQSNSTHHFFNPTQPNLWVDPTHVHVWREASRRQRYALQLISNHWRSTRNVVHLIDYLT